MACNGCQTGKVIPKIDFEPHVMRFTKKTIVEGVNGKSYALNQPLVPSNHFPRGHWAVTLTISGIPKRIDKPTAAEVFNEALRLVQLNKDPLWFIDIWLNCNLQWVSRVPQKYQIVTLKALRELSYEN